MTYADQAVAHLFKCSHQPCVAGDIDFMLELRKLRLSTIPLSSHSLLVTPSHTVAPTISTLPHNMFLGYLATFLMMITTTTITSITITSTNSITITNTNNITITNTNSNNHQQHR